MSHIRDLLRPLALLCLAPIAAPGAAAQQTQSADRELALVAPWESDSSGGACTSWSEDELRFSAHATEATEQESEEEFRDGAAPFDGPRPGRDVAPACGCGPRDARLALPAGAGEWRELARGPPPAAA